MPEYRVKLRRYDKVVRGFRTRDRKKADKMAEKYESQGIKAKVIQQLRKKKDDVM